MDNGTEILLDDNSRFEMKNGEVEILDNNGRIISGNIREYFDKQKKDNLTFFDKLKEGDIIKLKITGRIVVVKYVDYKVNGDVKCDYAGTLYGTDSTNLILFGQDDIEVKYNIIDSDQNIKKR